MSNGTSSLSESEVYRTLGSLVIHAEQIRWTRLNALIIMSSIFAGAWATVFTGTGYFCGKCWLLALFCFPGIVMGIIWPFLGWRASKDLEDCHRIARDMEQNFPTGLPRPWQGNQKRRGKTGKGWRKLTSSMFIVTATPVMFLVVFVALAVTSFILVTPCSSDKESYLSQQVGKVCKVQFMRNALGAGATLPVPPTTDVFNGAAVSLSGTLRAVERQAVLLNSGTKTYWIPKDCVLLIEVEK